MHGLLGGVADGLGNLPLVGDLLDNVGSSVASTAGNLLSMLEPVVSLVGVNGDDFGSGTAAPGQLSFGDGGGTTAHELATPGGGYTTYGIALNLGAGDAASASASGDVDAGALGSVLDSFADHLSGSHFDASSDALHLDQSVLRTASDILA